MKIWFDLTDIYDWEGSFTGIQRVVYNLGANFNQSIKDTHFFIYRAGIYQEITFEQLDLRLQETAILGKNIQKYKQTRGFAYAQHGALVFLKDSFRGTKAEPLVRGLYTSMRKVYRRVKSTHLRPSVYTSIFSEEDVVLICGGNWLVSGFVDEIIKKKEKVGFKLVHFVNDIIALRNPGLTNPGAEKIIGGYFRKIFSHADALIAISESTKRDIEWFIEKEKLTQTTVHVIKLGDNIEHTHKHAKEPSPKIQTPFILSVGTFEIRKNYHLLYYAYKLAAQKGIDLPQLVISGRKGWMYEETFYLLTHDTDVKDQITILNNVTDAELAWLYKNCSFTVFPSVYEGWGLPVAESLSYGKCCITTDASSMPEVGGQLATYISPYDPSALLTSIVDLSDTSLRNALEAKIEQEYRGQSWADSAKQLAKYLESEPRLTI